jgi:hypothetical protein
MAEIRCAEVVPGLRDSEVAPRFVDFAGRTHYIRVERDFLAEKDGLYFLPVDIVHVDPKTKAVLVELPHEAETGASRIGIKPEQLDEPVEEFA